MGKATGFLEYKREDDRVIEPIERIKNFKEFHVPLSAEERKEQGARCMNCGVPFCQSGMTIAGMVTGCPLHNLAPEWNDQIYHEHFALAFARLQKTNNFPEFTGRVCPALCEKACICGENGDAVTIHENERFLIETAFERGYVKPRVPQLRSGKTVAVVGGGPSGLAVADTLNQRGHLVHVFERDEQIGGLLMFGIPNMKLEKDVIERRRALMEKEGIVFHTGVNVGADKAAEELLAAYDAVVLCCGAKQARSLPAVQAVQPKGAYYAVDFLSETTRALLAGREPAVSAKGKHVVVVGGGDTGNDCIGTVIREGCKSVTALEMMPEPPEERLASNPWPQWPRVKKTDYGHQESIAIFGKDPRVYETTVKEILTDKKGTLKKIVTVKVAFKNGKMVEVEGTEQTLPCDLLLTAAGFTGCEPYTAEAFGVPLSARGTVVTTALPAPQKNLTDPEISYQTAKEKVFTAGDMRRGQSLVVWAIREGRECARQVDEYLMGYTRL